MPTPVRIRFEHNQKAIHLATAWDVNASGMVFILNDIPGEVK